MANTTEQGVLCVKNLIKLDLNPCDYLWRFLKAYVFRNNPHTVQGTRLITAAVDSTDKENGCCHGKFQSTPANDSMQRNHMLKMFQVNKNKTT
jgi:hypothetical protein